jgi:hypothetical protein
MSLLFLKSTNIIGKVNKKENEINSQSSGFVYGSETMGNKSSRITFTTLTVVYLPT